MRLPGYHVRAALPQRSTIWLMAGAFLCYTGMYAVRKSFLAAQFNDHMWGGLDLKTVLVISQVLGYMLSKFIGIKVISELSKNRRAALLTGLVGTGLLMLLLFYLLPAGLRPVAMFLNGIPLGMVFGIVFSYLEGRRNTELLAAALSATFIFSTGLVKSVGVWLVQVFAVSEFLMPFLTGALFFPVFLAAIGMMRMAGDPDLADMEERSVRQPMGSRERMLFVREFGTGFGLLVAIYILLTIVRDFRDNFMVELWAELGQLSKPELLTMTELPVALTVLAICASGILIRDNLKALTVGLLLVASGAALILVSTLCFRSGTVSPVLWMVLTGVGVYLPYILYHCLLFERLIAWLRFSGNVGFLFYVADALGYSGSVGIMMFKALFDVQREWVSFFTHLSIITSCLIIVLTLMLMVSMRQRAHRMR